MISSGSSPTTDHPRLRGENLTLFNASFLVPGPPPPARGERRAAGVPEHTRRTTPACAGRTGSTVGGHWSPPDHPRLRGENDHLNAGHGLDDGPPPPARGERSYDYLCWADERTTPACAGRTPPSSPQGRARADHPRLRGENLCDDEPRGVGHGPPPPARGELSPVFVEWLMGRTTPACAGRTFWSVTGISPSADHPRLRGENICTKRYVMPRTGPPPPARGERRAGCAWCRAWRTTPACAGRTHPRVCRAYSATDHPRLRGENSTEGWAVVARAGPPPPARGEPADHHEVRGRRRTTPACAGRTSGSSTSSRSGSDHPRLRGENSQV